MCRNFDQTRHVCVYDRSVPDSRQLHKVPLGIQFNVFIIVFDISIV